MTGNNFHVAFTSFQGALISLELCLATLIFLAFLNFCHIPVISALFVFGGCIAETISRLL